MTDSAGDPVNLLKRGNSIVSLPKQITLDAGILSEKYVMLLTNILFLQGIYLNKNVANMTLAS